MIPLHVETNFLPVSGTSFAQEREFDMAETDRPLSPHLQVWRWRLHMALSIAHRTTGMINAVGALIVVWGFVSLAVGPSYFDLFLGVMTSIGGKIVLLGITFSVMLHLCTGIRHLIMDTGRLFDLEANRRAGLIAISVAIVLTYVVWDTAYRIAGA